MRAGTQPPPGGPIEVPTPSPAHPPGDLPGRDPSIPSAPDPAPGPPAPDPGPPAAPDLPSEPQPAAAAGARGGRGRRGIVVVDDRIPVLHASWGAWRRARRGGPSAGRDGGGGCFCALCWGAGRILRAAGNGEGIVPVTCEWCGGSGRAPA